MATANIGQYFVIENNEIVYKCQKKDCKNKKFVTAWTLRRHTDRVHGKVFFSPIENCNEKFDTKTDTLRKSKYMFWQGQR